MELHTSRNPADYAELVAELGPELGPEFGEAIERWCLLLPRHRPLAHWEIYLAIAESQTIGITGLYRLPEAPLTEAWLGWFGVLRRARRRRHGSTLLALTVQRALELGASDFLICVALHSTGAQQFYMRNGFRLLPRSEWPRHYRLYDDTDVILHRKLCA